MQQPPMPPGGGPPPGPQFEPPGSYGQAPPGPPPAGGPPQGGPPSGPYGGPTQPAEPPAPPAGAPAAGAGGRTALMAGLGVVVVAGLAAGAYLAYTALHGKGDALTKRVPADADVYATAYLNPSASQKQNLDNLFGRFPVSNGQTPEQWITKQLDDSLKSQHLTFSGDIQPWLGSQLGVAARFPAASSGQPDTPQFELLINSKDDSAAQAFLSKAKNNQQHETWTTETHNGVTVNIGTGEGASSPDTVYAYVDKTVLLGNSPKLIEDSIDTDKGGKNLGDSDEYRKTLNNIPDDKLGLVFANAGQLLDRYTKLLKTGSSSCQPTTLTAIRGLALSVSSDPAGMALDTNVDIDNSRLDSGAKSAMGDNHQSAALDFMPKNSYAALGVTHLNDQVNSLINQCITDQSAKQQLNDLGVTGSGGVLTHMTGDVGLTVGPGSGSQYPTGALLIGTNDQNGMQSFLDKLVKLGSNLGSSSSSSGFGGSSSGSEFSPTPAQSETPTPTDSAGNPITPQPVPTDALGNPLPTDSNGNPLPTDSFGFPITPSPTPATPAPPQTNTYNGVTITSLPIESLTSLGIAPSYAVFDNMGVIALSPGELKAIIDAHHNKDAISNAPAFTDAKSHLPGGDAVNVFVDVQGIAKALNDVVHVNATSQIGPVKTVISGGQSGSDHVSGRFFVLIQ